MKEKKEYDNELEGDVSAEEYTENVPTEENPETFSLQEDTEDFSDVYSESFGSDSEQTDLTDETLDIQEQEESDWGIEESSPESESLEDPEEYEGNPADNDGLDSYEEDIDQVEKPTEEQDGESDIDSEASIKQGITREKNKAPFLDKFKILLIIFASLIILILASVFLVPGNKKKEQEDLLDKKGAAYIPDKIKTWEPNKFLTENSPFPGNTSSPTPDKTDDTLTDEEIEGLISSIPYSDEAQQQNTAPVPVPTNTTGYVSTAVVPTRPITNANEQQKQIPRMPLSDYSSPIGGTSSYQNTNMGNGTSSYMTSSDYAAYSQNRMNDLMAQMQGLNANTNSYLSQNMQNNKQQFFNQNSGNTNMQWNNEYSLFYGTIIPAVLITGINTDLPGVVIAQVTSNVYSSQTGEYLLIPAGTKIYATYNSSVSYGQDRVQVAWNKMIRPDGLEIDLGNFVGVDKRGYAGYDGWVNTHPFETLKALGLIAAFSIFDTKIGNMQAAQDNMYAQNVIAETYSEINKLGGKIIDRALDIQPTITIPQGKEVKIITNVTMTLPPFEQKQVYEKYVRK